MLNELNTQIGKNIRDKRTAINMSLEELAELLDLTPGFLGLIERGRRGATAKNLKNIAKTLNVNIDDLFHGVDKTQANPLKDKLNAYLTYLNEDDCKHLLDVCKFLRMKNERPTAMQCAE